MKTDNFTKLLLLLIALNLTILTLNNVTIFPSAYANNESLSFTSSNYSLVPVNSDGTITVSLSNLSEIDVNIVGINTNDELDVNIDKVGGGYVSYGGPLPVEIK